MLLRGHLNAFRQELSQRNAGDRAAYWSGAGRIRLVSSIEHQARSGIQPGFPQAAVIGTCPTQNDMDAEERQVLIAAIHAHDSAAVRDPASRALPGLKELQVRRHNT
jgi:predicted metal-dependent phosphotriesterase family hydrolase